VLEDKQAFITDEVRKRSAIVDVSREAQHGKKQDRKEIRLNVMDSFKRNKKVHIGISQGDRVIQLKLINQRLELKIR
jgi:hypothetical protein